MTEKQAKQKAIEQIHKNLEAWISLPNASKKIVDICTEKLSLLEEDFQSEFASTISIYTEAFKKHDSNNNEENHEVFCGI